MGPRLVMGILVYVGCMALLLASAALTAESSDQWQFGSLITVVAIYSGLMWIRDRYFPAGESETREGAPGLLMQRVREPWSLLTTSFVLIAVPLMITMRSDVALEPAAATRLAFKLTAWGALVPAIALLIARFPIDRSAQIFEWWLPGGLLVLLSVFLVRLLPELVLLVAGQADADLPNVAPLLIAPVAAFAWRALEFVRKGSSH